MLEELDILGVNQKMLFPDLVGVAEYIVWKRTNRP